MKSELQAMLNALKRAGWQVEMRSPSSHEVKLPAAIGERFGAAPGDYLEFLSSVSMCVNPSNNAWFLCESDFRLQDADAFEWDWIEKTFPPERATVANKGASCTALEPKCPDELDVWQAFWREHLPIFFSVHSDYAYFALRRAKGEWKDVVSGAAPEFEEAIHISGSFTHLCVMLTEFYERGVQLPAAVSIHL
jgi:hypothetical protein